MADKPGPSGSASEEELKQLLFARELRLLADLKAKADRLEARVGDAPALSRSMEDVLVEVLRKADARDHDRVVEALAPLIASSLKLEAAGRRGPMVNALGPLAGRVLSASVGHAAAKVVRGVDRAIVGAFSPLRWRARGIALITGCSSAEALQRIKPGFHIAAYLVADRASGAVLAESGFDDEGAAARDRRAGVLNALLTIARNALHPSAEGDLRRLTVGGVEIFARTSPAILLAVQPGGPIPPDFETRIGAVFDQFLDAEAKPLRDDPTTDPDAIGPVRDGFEARLARLTDAIHLARRPPPVAGRMVTALALIAMAAAAGYFGHEAYQADRIERQAQAIVADIPELAGFQVVATVNDGELRVRGLTPNAAVRQDLAGRLVAYARQNDLRAALQLNALPTPAVQSADAVAAVLLPRVQSEMAPLSAAVAEAAFLIQDIEDGLAAQADRTLAQQQALVALKADLEGARLALEAEQLAASSARDRLAADVAQTREATAAVRQDLAAVERQGAERNERLAAIDRQGAERDDRLTAIDRQGSERDERLAAIDRQGAERDERLTAVDRQGAERDGRLAAAIAGIDAAGRQIDRLDAALAELGADLKSVTLTARAERDALAAQAAAGNSQSDALAASLAAADSRVLDIAAAVTAVQTSIAAGTERLQATEQALEGLADLPDAAAAAAREIARAQETLQTLTAAQAALQERITEAGDARAAALRALDDTSGRIAALDERVAALAEQSGAQAAAGLMALKAEIEANESRIEAATNERLALVAALGARVTALEAAEASADRDAAIAELDQSLQALNAQSAAMATTIAGLEMQLAAAPAATPAANAPEVSASAGPSGSDVIARLEGLEERAGEAIAMLDQRIDRIAKEAQPRAASPHQTAQAQLARYTIRFAESTQPADRESANEVLQRVAEIALAMPQNVRLRIIGFADSDGTVEANRITSKRRSDWALDALLQLGVPAAKMVSVGRGAERLLSADAGDDSPNRRVEFEAF